MITPMTAALVGATRSAWHAAEYPDSLPAQEEASRWWAAAGMDYLGALAAVMTKHPTMTAGAAKIRLAEASSAAAARLSV